MSLDEHYRILLSLSQVQGTRVCGLVGFTTRGADKRFYIEEYRQAHQGSIRAWVNYLNTDPQVDGKFGRGSND